MTFSPRPSFQASIGIEVPYDYRSCVSSVAFVPSAPSSTLHVYLAVVAYKEKENEKENEKAKVKSDLKVESGS